MRDLVSLVYGPRKQWAEAEAAVAEGVRHGADRATLYLALADQRQWTGDLDAAVAALEQAIGARPSDAGLAIRLGQVYWQLREFGDAARAYTRASQLDPRSADAFYLLAGAEEANYDYSAAARNYQHAIALAPSRADWSAQYQRFLREIALGAGQAPAVH